MPTCFLDRLYTNMPKCATDTNYSTNKAYAINTCCGRGGYYTPLTVEYIISPARIFEAVLLYKKIKERSILALGGGQIGPDRLRY